MSGGKKGNLVSPRKKPLFRERETRGAPNRRESLIKRFFPRGKKPENTPKKGEIGAPENGDPFPLGPPGKENR